MKLDSKQQGGILFKNFLTNDTSNNIIKDFFLSQLGGITTEKKLKKREYNFQRYWSDPEKFKKERRERYQIKKQENFYNEKKDRTKNCLNKKNINKNYYLKNHELLKQRKGWKYWTNKKTEQKIVWTNSVSRKHVGDSYISSKGELIKDSKKKKAPFSSVFSLTDKLNWFGILVKSLDSSDKRIGCIGKSPAINGKGWNDPKFKVKQTFEELKADPRFTHLGVRGGRDYGKGCRGERSRGVICMLDLDFINKSSNKSSNSFKESWRSKTLIKNFKKWLQEENIMFGETKHGFRVAIQSCCPLPNLELFHTDSFKQRTVSVGELRAKERFTVIEGENYNWLNKGKTRLYLRCNENGNSLEQFLGKIKTKLYVDCKIVGEKKEFQSLSKVSNKIESEIDSPKLFVTKAKILSKLELTDKATDYYVPVVIHYLNDKNQKKYFILNVRQEQQRRFKDFVFLENSVHNLQLLWGNHQVFFNRLC